MSTSNVRPWFVRIGSFIPAWMANRPGFQTFAKLLFVHALMCDQAIQVALEGVRAGFPGYDERTDNLGLIGASRGLIQGETETADHFIARLQNWLTTAKDMGGDVGMALQLWNYIAGNPPLRVISRNGLFTSVDADGNVTQTQTSGVWNWDSVCSPERANDWWDYWVVIYPTQGYVVDTGVWGDSGEASLPPVSNPVDYDIGIGHTCTRAEVGAITTILRQWKGQHVNLKCVIWSYGTDYYAPTGPVSGSPDGTWGLWLNRSTNTPTRNTTDRFWDTGFDFSFSKLSP